MGQLGSLLFLGQLIGIGLVIWWAIKNDDAGDTGATHGLLAMRDHRPPEERAKDVAAATSKKRRKPRPWLRDDEAEQG